MRRALQATVLGIFTLLLVTGFQPQMTSAQIGDDPITPEEINLGYIIGPVFVDGIGDNPTEARSNAFAEFYDTLAEIEASLPEDEYVSGYEILYEGFFDSGLYEIEFNVFIGIEDSGIIF